jgi:hypothetical protein
MIKIKIRTWIELAIFVAVTLFSVLFIISEIKYFY